MSTYESLDDPDMLRRAHAAWYATGGTSQPTTSRHVRLGGLEYVVLGGAGGMLAAYRVRNDGHLKRLRRWPAELEEITARRKP